MNNIRAVIAIVAIWAVFGYIYTHLPLAWLTDGVTLVLILACLASTGLVALVFDNKKGS